MVLCFIICFLAQLYLSSCGPYSCDPTKDAVHEGNNGESAALSWLGILRVNIFEGRSMRIALTGLVLVKESYAVANADDIARMPRSYITERSKAMFIPKPDTPWYCTVKDFMLHPEYQYSTMNTLALLELESETNFFPMKPICWPPFTINTTTHLYAFGYTDENQLLEKSVYTLKNVDLNICKDFYNRAGFTEGMLAPNSYLCVYAARNKRDCQWDNGMVLASNSTGYWKLLGFGVKGPGCSAPARFINMLSYFTWIDTSTEQYNAEDELRRSGLIKYRPAKVEEVPVHSLFTLSEVQSRRVWCPQEKSLFFHGTYPFDTEQYQDRYYTIDRIDGDNVVIWAENVTVPHQHGNCSAKSKLVFSEKTRLKHEGSYAKAIYKLSVMDLNELEFTCIDIKVIPRAIDKKIDASATIYYGVEIDNAEGMSGIKQLPPGLLKSYLQRPMSLTTSTELPPAMEPPTAEWQPGPQLKIKYIHDKHYVIKQPNINILLRFYYKNEAMYIIAIYRAESVKTEEPPRKPAEKKGKRGRKKPNFAESPTADEYFARSYTMFNETLNSNLERAMGVEVKQVDRYMKEISSSATEIAEVRALVFIVMFFILV